MGLFDVLFEDSNGKSKTTVDWDRSIFDTDRFCNLKSGNWGDREDIIIGDVKTN